MRAASGSASKNTKQWDDQVIGSTSSMCFTAVKSFNKLSVEQPLRLRQAHGSCEVSAVGMCIIHVCDSCAALLGCTALMLTVNENSADSAVLVPRMHVSCM